MRGCWNISSLVVWLDFLFEGVQWNFSKYFLYWFMLSSCSPYLKKSFITFVNRIKSLMLVLSTELIIYRVSFFIYSLWTRWTQLYGKGSVWNRPPPPCPVSTLARLGGAQVLKETKKRGLFFFFILDFSPTAKLVKFTI